MPDYIDEVQIDSLLTQLNRLRDELDGEVSTLQSHSVPDQEDLQADKAVNQTLAKLTLNQYEQRLKLIDEALHRIEADDYGFCQSCGAAIGFSQLIAEPEIRLCVNCASK